MGLLIGLHAGPRTQGGEIKGSTILLKEDKRETGEHTQLYLFFDLVQ